MAVTAQELLQAVNAAGIDTPAKAAFAFGQLALQARLRKVEAEIAKLYGDKTTATAPIDNQIILLKNEKAALEAQILGV